MPKISISYRRADSEAMTGRIFDRLTAHYGKEAIFRDIDDIPAGTDFRVHINEVLRSTHILLAIVGPAWLGALIALCDGLNRVGFVKWFADGIAPHMKEFSPHMAMIILLAIFFVAHYLFASVDAYTTALLPVILLTGAAIPGIPLKEFALLLCMELGIMGIITPFADAASPIYANSGYLPAKDYWRLGTIFGALFLIFFLAVGVPWASFLWKQW